MNSLTVLRSWFSGDHSDGEDKEDERKNLVAKITTDVLKLKKKNAKNGSNFVVLPS